MPNIAGGFKRAVLASYNSCNAPVRSANFGGSTESAKKPDVGARNAA